MTYQNILVLGGTGFVGQSLVERLVAQGRTVCVPTRRRAHARELLVLPTVEVVEADIHDAAVLRGLLAGRDAVINLVGILHDPGRPTPASGGRYGAGFAAAHVALPQALAAACQETGVRRLLHVSALGADPSGPSGYLRSKGDGERALRTAHGLDATVFRPSVVFGRGDRFLNLFAALAALAPVLFIGGAQSRMQPVWVQDLSAAMAHVLDARETAGQAYEVCGPAIYTLRELVAFAAQAAGHPRPVVGLPAPLAMAMAAVLERLPGPTLLSRDNLRSLSVDCIASVQPYQPAPELGMHPAPLEPEASLYLSGLHPRTRFSGFRARAGR
jgi:NADH dehydrogenase